MTNKSGQESAFKKFLKENKSLAFMLPVLAILIIVLIIVYSGVFSKKEAPASSGETPPAITQPSESALAQQPQVDVLPQIIRSTSEGAVDVIKDPFESPVKLSGIIYSTDRSTAIVESNGISYIVKEDDFLGDSTWRVTLIQKDSITLESGEKSISLSLNDE